MPNNEVILGNFDFHKVQRIMDTLNWEWINGIPTVSELVETSKDLLNELKNSDSRTMSVATGGLRASRHKGEDGKEYFSLEFVVESTDDEGY